MRLALSRVSPIHLSSLRVPSPAYIRLRTVHQAVTTRWILSHLAPAARNLSPSSRSGLHQSISIMSSVKPPPSDLPIHSFPSVTGLEQFYEANHATSPGFYLKLAKKSSGIASVSPSDAVETALCFGWIDGRANAFDGNWWLARYTPRRSKSIWSQKNVNTIGRLMEEGRMRTAGTAAVDAAKADGRWERAYAGPATITVPDDFTAALGSNEAAKDFFEGLNRSDRYSVLWRVETASLQSRAKRIEAIIQLLAAAQVPGAVTKAAEKPKKIVAAKKAVKEKDAKSKKRKGAPTVEDEAEKPPRREGLRRRV
jgi:uncharacterized protein YdeI (YjbR/CyaY-like superfamily)